MVVRIKFIVGVLCLIVVDFITKFFAKKYLLHCSIHIWRDVFSLKYVSNSGISLSMFAGNKYVTLILPAVLMVIAAFVYIKFFKKYKIEKIMSMVFTAGVLGNYLERLVTGQVTDFISIKGFAVFNFADICTSTGIVVLTIRYYYNSYKK